MKSFPHFLAIILLAFAISTSNAQQAGLLKVGEEIIITIKAGGPDGKDVGSVYKISDQGFVPIPVLGVSVPAAGLTCSQLARNIEASYRTWEFFSDPVVTVALPVCAKSTPNTVTIGGEVRAAGEYPFRKGMALKIVIDRAGGYTAFDRVGKRCSVAQTGSLGASSRSPLRMANPAQ